MQQFQRETTAEDVCGDAETLVEPGGWQPVGATWLRRALVVGDVVCLFLAAALVSLATGWQTGEPLMDTSFGRSAVFAVVGALLLHRKGLYRSARSSVPILEISALVDVGAGLVVASILLDQLSGVDVRWVLPLAQAGVAVAVLVVWRSLFRARLRALRPHGRHERPVVMVGTDREAARLHRILGDHTDQGYRCLGVVGDREEALANGLAAHWIGPIDHALALVQAGRSSGVVLVPSAIGGVEAKELTAAVQAAGGHVHVGSPIGSIDHRRLIAQPIAFEPMLYVEPPALRSHGAGDLAKRIVDIVGASVGLVLTAPLLGAAAVAIKASGGPVLFRQRRVGRNDEPFTMLKLRTMVEDAESMVIDLTDLNDREGPLFKATEDPRVTKIGRILRATDLDEVPQLINVLRGEMSLVGPRPALPDEVKLFNPELRRRTRALPGITGLWQVESRHHSSFAAYERLDLFYVDNRSLTLDLVIILLTFESMVTQRLGLRGRRAQEQHDGVFAMPDGAAGSAPA